MGEDGGSSQDFDILLDAIDRSERQTDVQIDRLNEFSDRASKTLRFVILVIGAFITALTFVYSNSDIEQGGELLSAILLLAVGFTGLLLSIFYASLVNLVSVFSYGPRVSIDQLTDEDVRAKEYKTGILQAYYTVYENNREVLVTKSRRLRRSHVFLFIGIFVVTFGLVLLALNLHVLVEYLLPLVVVVVSLAFYDYMERESYLVISMDDADSENDE